MGRQPLSAISGDDLLIATYIAIVPGRRSLRDHLAAAARAGQRPPGHAARHAVPRGGLAGVLLGQRITVLHVLGGLVTIAGVAGSLLSPGGKRVVEGSPDPTIVLGD